MTPTTMVPYKAENANRYLERAARTVVNLGQSALATTKDVALAVLASSHETQQQQLDLIRENQERLFFLACRQQEQERNTAQTLCTALSQQGENHRAAEQDLQITFLKNEHGFLQMALDHPEQQASLLSSREQQVYSALIGLQQTKQREQEAKTRAAIADFRQKRIDAVQNSIKHTISSIKSEQQTKTAVVLAACTTFGAVTCLGDPAVTLAVAVASLCVAYTLFSQLSDLQAKQRWMEIYSHALDSLQRDPTLTVRTAIEQQLQSDPSIDPAFLEAEKTQRILNTIPEEPLQRGPYQTGERPLPALEALLTHSRAAPSSFHPLQSRSKAQAWQVLRNPFS